VGWRMLGAVVAKTALAPPAEDHSVGIKEAGPSHLGSTGPPRRAKRRDPFGFASPPNRHADRYREGGGSARSGNLNAFDEHSGGVGVVGEPPEEGQWEIGVNTHQTEPGRAQLWLIGKPPRDPFRRSPDQAECGDPHDE